MTKDLFSAQAALYAKYRPTYPQALIEYVLTFTGQRDLAWDCATGNGQAALLYADHFNRVLATDTSEKQLALAVAHPKIKYELASAEKTHFEDNQFDLITVAQAYHWFDFNAFYTEACRVGRNGAVVAIWGYGLTSVADKKVDALVRHFYVDVVGKYWDPERKYVDDAYQTVPFAFERLPSKAFSIEVEWDYQELIGYFHTWSSVQHFIRAEGIDPVDRVAASLLSAWGDPENKLAFSFPLFLLLGRIAK